MKKLLGIVVISFLLSGNAYSVFDIFFLEVSSMLSGAILIFLYFTNLSKKFK